jgi:hypothetical protein
MHNRILKLSSSLAASALILSLASQAGAQAPSAERAQHGRATPAPQPSAAQFSQLLGPLPIQGALREQAPFFAAALSEFFTDSRDYSARAELILPEQEPGDSIPIGLAVSGGRMRWQLNLNQVRSARFPPERIALLRQMSLDTAVLWLKPGEDLKVALPRLKAWAQTPTPTFPAIEEQAANKQGKLRKTAIGREVIDGHPCVKHMLNAPDENNPGQVALIWEATDLENLPIKILVKTDGRIHGFQLRNVKPGQIDERHFQPPAAFVRKPSMAALLQQGIAEGLARSSQTGGLPSLEGLLSEP